MFGCTILSLASLEAQKLDTAISLSSKEQKLNKYPLLNNKS